GAVEQSAPEGGGGFVGSSADETADETPLGATETPPYLLVDSPALLPAVAQAVNESSMVGLDLETTGLDPRTDRIRLLSLSTARGTFLVDCFQVNPAPLFESLAEHELIAHNAIFDLGFLAQLGFTPGVAHCTQLLSQLLDAGLKVKKGYHTL